MTNVPSEARPLLATTPESFVAERAHVVRELREAGRTEDARAVAALRKPPGVVLAVNRAARGRPQAARDAVRAAETLAKTQLSGRTGDYDKVLKDLENALALLAEVAVAHLSREKPANESMRRRVADLLRAAAADSASREALEQGLLQEEGGAVGFSAFAGMSAPAGKRKASSSRTKEAERHEKASRDRKRRLEEELVHAQDALETAERSLAAAQRERDKAARAVTRAAKRLEG